MIEVVDKVSGKMPRVVLTHSSGASAEVYLHGAHITSWKVGEREMLFMSEKSHFAPGKPIRGGIPVIFPQFGAGELPQHGFARISEWELEGAELTDDGDVAVNLQLTESELWPHPFALRLGVLLGADSLMVRMRVKNTGSAPFPFQAVLHTYFAVEDIRETAVRGLTGVTYVDDTLAGNPREVEERQEIRFSGETDRIYVDTPNKLSVNGVTIEKSGMPDVVVWNPWIDKSKRMEDFGDDEYPRMVCVETGAIEPPLTLDPGGVWEGSTVFTASRR
ncbi:MAG: D-hexose-6-phosphate mutarotase [Armatimonadota bacterium]